MSNFSRRDFLKETVLTTAAGWTLSVNRALNAAETNTGVLHIAPFKFDVTPPLGHSHVRVSASSGLDAKRLRPRGQPTTSTACRRLVDFFSTQTQSQLISRDYRSSIASA